MIKFRKIENPPGKTAAEKFKNAKSSSPGRPADGGPVKSETKISTVDGPEKFTPSVGPGAPLIVPPTVAARMEKEGVNMDGVEVQKKIPGSAPSGKASPGKKLQSLRLDLDVIDGFKAKGPGWQGNINAALRQHLGI